MNDAKRVEIEAKIVKRIEEALDGSQDPERVHGWMVLRSLSRIAETDLPTNRSVS